MQFPRMTTRRWMVAIALAASLLAVGVTLYRRSVYFESLADDHESQSGIALFAIDPLPRRDGILPTAHLVIDGVEYLDAEADWHGRLAAKYRRAARYPWLPVEPDSPAPKAHARAFRRTTPRPPISPLLSGPKPEGQT